MQRAHASGTMHNGSAFDAHGSVKTRSMMYMGVGRLVLPCAKTQAGVLQRAAASVHSLAHIRESRTAR